MTRVPNWDVLLARWAMAQIGKPYDWGRTDCGTLIRRAHRIMFGRDIFRLPYYSTKREALAFIQKYGDVETVLRHTGAVEVRRNFVQQGDVLIEPDDGHGLNSCAVVVGNSLLYATLDDGVKAAPLNHENGLFLRVPHG